MEDAKKNKSVKPKLNKTPWNTGGLVKIKINANRAIAGLGKAGDVVEVSELVAKNFVSQGFATIVEKEKTNHE